MNLKAKTLFSILALGLVLSLGAHDARAQIDPPGVNPTHWWTYHRLSPFISQQGVGLSDQFYPQQFIPNGTDSLVRLLNWVYKNHGVVQDTFIHYTWWNLLNKVPTPRLVKVTNQFGTYDVNVEQMEFLLAPAWKNYQSPIPYPYANHYLCYRAHGFPAPSVSFFFQDEWRQDVLPVGPMEYFCTPCAKRHNGQLFPPVDTLTHLAVYPIFPNSDAFFAQTQDQFAIVPGPVMQLPIEYLFVPSTKFEINTPAKAHSWGKIRTLYR